MILALQPPDNRHGASQRSDHDRQADPLGDEGVESIFHRSQPRPEPEVRAKRSHLDGGLGRLGFGWFRFGFDEGDGFRFGLGRGDLWLGFGWFRVGLGERDGFRVGFDEGGGLGLGEREGFGFGEREGFGFGEGDWYGFRLGVDKGKTFRL